MDYPKSDMVWVFVELRSPNGTRSFRGRVRHTDFDAILEGNFRKAFFALEDTHWPELGQGNQQPNQQERMVIVGRDAHWKGLTGTFHLPVRDIITIAPMRNSNDVFLPVATPENALSRWEQALLATPQVEGVEGIQDTTDSIRTDSNGVYEATEEDPKG